MIFVDLMEEIEKGTQLQVVHLCMRLEVKKNDVFCNTCKP